MKRVLYSDPAFPQNVRAYCDSSFILDLWSYDQVIVQKKGRISSQKRVRITEAFNYFDSAQKVGVRFCASVFSVEECYHVLLSAPIRLATSKAGLRTWKELRISDASTFKTAISQGRAALESFAFFFDKLSIDPLFFGRQADGTYVLETGIAADARLLLQMYELDCMDAFHFAILKRFDIEVAVSSDSDWLQIRGNRVLVTAA